MRSIVLFALAAVTFGCATSPGPVQPNSAGTNTAANDRSSTTIAHSTENRTAPSVKSGDKSKWTQSGEPIDTKAFDEAIKTAEKSADKKAIGTAYYKRAVALTDARQYASALGDYRKALKNDPTNAEAKQWVDMIVSIYEGKNQEFPKEGEEPPALPFGK